MIRYTVSWSVDPAAAQVGSLNGLCLVNPGEQPPRFGFEYHLIGTDATGAVVDERFRCIAFPNGDPTQRPALPPLPAVPTFAEAWNAAQIPAPAIALDPPSRGITGLDTRISTSGPTTLAISATVRGYTITGTATLDHYTVSVDGSPASTLTATGGVAHYTFETKGMHLVTIGAVWHATATLAGEALPVTLPPVDLGRATVTTTRPYQVNEIRSVLQP